MARTRGTTRQADNDETDDWYDAVYARLDSAWRDTGFLARTTRIPSADREHVSTNALGQFFADVLVAQGMTGDDAADFLQECMDVAEENAERPPPARQRREDHEEDD